MRDAPEFVRRARELAAHASITTDAIVLGAITVGRASPAARGARFELLTAATELRAAAVRLDILAEGIKVASVRMG